MPKLNEGPRFYYDNNSNTFLVSNLIKDVSKTPIPDLVEIMLGHKNGQKIVAALAIEALTNRANNKKPLPSPAQRAVDSLLDSCPVDLGTPMSYNNPYPEEEFLKLDEDSGEDDYDDDDDGDIIVRR